MNQEHLCEPRPQHDRLLKIFVVPDKEAWAEYDTYDWPPFEFGIVFCPYCGERLVRAKRPA